MKLKYFKHLVFSAGIISLLSAGCTKKADSLLNTQSEFGNSSLVQVYLATVNASRNYVYVDGKPISGALISSGGVFPASGPAASLPTGINSFLIRDTLPATFQQPLAFAENFQGGNRYTVFVYDTITTPKQKTVQTNIVIPTDTSARLRFANFTYSPSNPGTFDIFSKKKNANIFTNVAVTDVSSYIPYPSAITDTFYIRMAGSTTNLQNINPTTGTSVDIIGVLTPVAKRSYTLVFRGGFRAVATNATTVRTLSTFANY
jgi:hypothetical protein